MLLTHRTTQKEVTLFSFSWLQNTSRVRVPLLHIIKCRTEAALVFLVRLARLERYVSIPFEIFFLFDLGQVPQIPLIQDDGPVLPGCLDSF